MKKIFAMLMTAAMLLTLMAFLPASASSENVPKFYLEGPTSAKAGETITVKLLVSGEYEAHTLNLRVYFDNTSFELVGKTFGEAYQEAISIGGWGMCEVNQQHNAVSLGMLMFSEPMSSVGELVSFDFEVLGTASSSADFMVTVEELGYMPVGQSDSTPLAYNTSGLTVKVTGGTGSGTTPNPIVTPRPGGVVPGKTDSPAATQNNTSRETPAPGTTEPAGLTPQPGTTDQATEPADMETTDPSDTAEPGVTEGAEETPAPGETADPNASAEPDASGEPGGDNENKGGKSKVGGVIAICAAVVAAAAALVAVLTKRSKNRKEK